MQFLSMRVVLTLLLLNILSISTEIVFLNDDNFESLTPKYTVLFAMFFQPDCVHSQNLDGEFLKAEEKIKPLNLPVNFAKINCQSSGVKVCEKLEIKAYPVIKVFNFGEFVFNYEGAKQAEGIVKFLRFKLEPGSQKIDNLPELSSCLSGFDNAVVGFFNSEKSELEKVFHQMAESLKMDYKFAHTYSAKLMNMFGYRDEIVLFRSDRLKTTLEPSQVKFEGENTLYNLRNWVSSVYQGLAGYRTKKNIELFKSPQLIAYMYIDFESKTSMSHYYRNRLIMAARKFTKSVPGVREKVNFAVSDLNEFKKDLEEFGVGEIPKDPNTIIITARDLQQKKYLFDRNIPFSSEAVEGFLGDIFDGKVSPLVKSQQVPLDDLEDSYVTTAVGTTFDSLVLDSEVDVLVQLFLPWSSDCRTAAEVLQKVAKKLKEEKNFRMVKIDMTANEVSRPFVVKGYPSVYLAKRYQKDKPIFYEGAQTVKDYINFIAANSTFPLKKFDRSGNKISSEKVPEHSIKTEL